MATKPILLSELLLDPQNPRHDIMENQPEILEAMASDNKTYNLAKDIAKYGLNPLDAILVMHSEEQKGKYTVLEGNRRTTALKLLNHPNIVPIVASKFQKIVSDFNFLVPDNIECVVVKDRDEADHWLRLKHGGELKGAGIVNWDAELLARYDQRRGINGPNALALMLLDYAIEKGFVLPDVRGDFPITTLTRLVNDAKIQSKLGISKNKDSTEFSIHSEELDKFAKRAVADVATGVKKARDWDKKEDRESYLGKC